MFRAVQLAKNGLGTTRPNPMVGCVIVNDEKIIAEGFTSAYGGPHAEVNAINSVNDKSMLDQATLYVSLEPCSHHGKTPPCTDLIIAHKIPRVVIGLKDPHEKVAGMGIQKLRESGCEVAVGILEDECREHHKRYLTYHEKKRPYIILKWAESFDGFIAPDKSLRYSKSEPYWISNTKSRHLVHQWRSEEQAILVGTNTVLEDNPTLNVRDWQGRSPIRIIIDRDLRIPAGHHVLDGSIPTMIITSKIDSTGLKTGVDYHNADFSKNLSEQICNLLYGENITSVLVEGGAKTLQAFLDADLWDEARVFIGNTSFNSGIKAPLYNGKKTSEEKIIKDYLSIYRND